MTDPRVADVWGDIDADDDERAPRTPRLWGDLRALCAFRGRSDVRGANTSQNAQKPRTRGR